MASHRADTYNPPFTTFGEFLQYLRRQAGLTQRDLGLAVGYSITHISLLENGKRRPHPTIVAALFVSALGLQNKPLLAEQLVQLASLSHDAINAEGTLDTAEQMSGTAPTIMNTVWSVHHNSLNGISSLPVPSPLLPLIGRNQDLISIVETLADPSVRLLTLVGPPGVGKTRLAIQVCWEIQNSFADGVHFVDLADVHDPAQVRYTIMQVLDPARALQAEDDISHRPLQQFVADKHMVLVLDNFEHLLPASLLVTELLESALQLKILTTSREPLQIYGEYEIQISPLSIPDLEHLPPIEALAEMPSVKLFVERARTVKPGFSLDSQNAEAISAICVRLDGLPLAIELAAVQVKMFTLEDLLDRLCQSEHFQPSDNGAWLIRKIRNLPSRHQTLIKAIDWSYRLLSNEEQNLLARLSIFIGGFDLDAACAISESEGLSAPFTTSVQVLLQSLVDKSLLHRTERDNKPRFRMLETIRSFAIERLIESNQEQTVRALHASYFLALAERIAPYLSGPETSLSMKGLEHEHDNFQAALSWMLQAGTDRHVFIEDQPVYHLGLRLYIALWRFWRYR